MNSKRTDIVTFIILLATIIFMVDFKDLGVLDYAILALGVLWSALTIVKWRKHK
ncbi:hypothetical protein [Paenibacillus marinisediminis]